MRVNLFARYATIWLRRLVKTGRCETEIHSTPKSVKKGLLGLLCEREISAVLVEFSAVLVENSKRLADFCA